MNTQLRFKPVVTAVTLFRIMTTLAFAFGGTNVYAQSATLTPARDIGMHTVPVDIPAKFTGKFPTGKTINVQSDYTVSVFYAGGLGKPRFMAFSPSGVLHVSDMTNGNVLALPDADNDGVADTVIEAATGFSGNHDVKFYKGAMYVTEATRIWKCTDTDGDGIYETKTIFIDGLGAGSTGGHVTRTLVFDPANEKAYVSIGSSCNVCREENRAIIEQYNDDGTGRRVFATGTRNAVGMALQPSTGKLWANNNGSDQQGNETPPEWIDIVRDAGFYGHPLAYGSGVWFDFAAHADYTALLPITATDSAKVASMVAPAALIRAHSAPMGLQFLDATFSPAMRYGFLTALRGSWNTTAPNNFRGFKVIYGHLADAADTTVDYVADFCTGFLTDTVARTYWGRPVGLATDANGKVYISSDEGNKFILVLTPRAGTGISTPKPVQLELGAVYPNPFKTSFTFSFTLTRTSSVHVVVRDMHGKEVMHVLDQQLGAGVYQKNVDGVNLSSGIYYLSLSTGDAAATEKIIIE
ncbi:MAG: T9SS type A sorting domain-containing protein [Chitinophagaceae bacterium]